MKNNCRIWLCIFLALFCMPIYAQQTIEDLLEQIKVDLESTNSENQKTTIKGMVQKRNDGNPSFADRLGGTFSNFEHLFQGLIELEPEEDGKALAARWNSAKKFLGMSLSLAAIAREPSIFDGLETSLTEAERANLTANLKKKLSDDDDLAFSLTANLETTRLGQKNYLANKDLLSGFLGVISSKNTTEAYTFDPVVEMNLDDPKPQKAEKAATWIKPEYQQEWRDKLKTPRLKFMALGLHYFTKAGLAHLRYLLIQEINTDAKYLEKFRSLAAQHNFEEIANRLYNQPQFNVSLTYRKRDALVGPNQFSAKLTFEKGFENLNTLRTALKNVSQSGKQGNSQLDAFHEALGDSSANKNRRLALNLSYERTESYDNGFLVREGLSEDNFETLSMPAFDATMAKLTYGQNIAMNQDGSNPYRLELGAEFQSFPAEAVKPDKFVATLTLTSLLTDKITAPISLIYANKEMFLGEVDQKFSINFGVRFWQK